MQQVNKSASLIKSIQVSNELVIFLDFDGVLHRKYDGTFELVSNLFRILESFPNAKLVISSNWRNGMSNQAYFDIFGDYVKRIIGQLPPDDSGNREYEILKYVKAHNIKRFIAIDDDCRRELFSENCKWLFRTNFYRGLDEDSTLELYNFLKDY